MSKKLSLVVLVLAAAVAILANVPRDVVLPTGSALAVLLGVWAYGRALVDWVAAGTHYGT